LTGTVVFDKCTFVYKRKKTKHSANSATATTWMKESVRDVCIYISKECRIGQVEFLGCNFFGDVGTLSEDVLCTFRKCVFRLTDSPEEEIRVTKNQDVSQFIYLYVQGSACFENCDMGPLTVWCSVMSRSSRKQAARVSFHSCMFSPLLPSKLSCILLYDSGIHLQIGGVTTILLPCTTLLRQQQDTVIKGILVGMKCMPSLISIDDYSMVVLGMQRGCEETCMYDCTEPPAACRKMHLFDFIDQQQVDAEYKQGGSSKGSSSRSRTIIPGCLGYPECKVEEPKVFWYKSPAENRAPFLPDEILSQGGCVTNMDKMWKKQEIRSLFLGDDPAFILKNEFVKAYVEVCVCGTI